MTAWQNTDIIHPPWDSTAIAQTECLILRESVFVARKRLPGRSSIKGRPDRQQIDGCHDQDQAPGCGMATQFVDLYLVLRGLAGSNSSSVRRPSRFRSSFLSAAA